MMIRRISSMPSKSSKRKPCRERNLLSILSLRRMLCRKFITHLLPHFIYPFRTIHISLFWWIFVNKNKKKIKTVNKPTNIHFWFARSRWRLRTYSRKGHSRWRETDQDMGSIDSLSSRRVACKRYNLSRSQTRKRSSWWKGQFTLNWLWSCKKRC